MNSDQCVVYPDEAGLMILPWASLFPGAMMPLKIFEERYQEMLQCALGSHRMFAIAHTPGEEHDCDPLGSLGLVRACVKNEDGSSNLILQGICRVNFQEILLTPHPRGRFSVFTDPEETSFVFESLRKKIHTLFKARATGVLDIPESYVNQLENITNHGALTDMIASAVVQNEETRRLLLEEKNVLTRMEIVLALLEEQATG